MCFFHPDRADFFSETLTQLLNIFARDEFVGAQIKGAGRNRGDRRVLQLELVREVELMTLGLVLQPAEECSEEIRI